MTTNICLNTVETTTFPDGMKAINTTIPLYLPVHVVGSVCTFEDLFLLAQIVDRARQAKSPKVTAVLHYIVGSRMDRDGMGVFPNVTKVVCDFINNLNLDEVGLVWPHSSSLLDRLNNCTHHVDIEQAFICKGIRRSLEKFGGETEFTLLLPDAGAGKRFWNDHAEIVGVFPNMQVVEGSKHRDVKTGNLDGFGVPEECLPHTIMVDDLCDGGGTFCGLAGVARENGAEKISLVAYHGIMSKGFDLEGIDYIYTSNSFRNCTFDELGVDIGKVGLYPASVKT